MQSKSKRLDPSRVRVEKRPGPDWVVGVLVASENKVHPVTVFGARDEHEAVRDALAGFAPNRRPDELMVLEVERPPDEQATGMA
ncbi:hypothetical protein GCM10009416_50200 [Craurococcus roseus]|uniref:Uncharacterized protein n=1 Tax=Craurococcus roseus TaxID=77585 RepID=A0ABP3RBB3_9PROT